MDDASSPRCGSPSRGAILELGAALTVASGWQRMIEAFGIRPDGWTEATPLPWVQEAGPGAP